MSNKALIWYNIILMVVMIGALFGSIVAQIRFQASSYEDRGRVVIKNGKAEFVAKDADFKEVAKGYEAYSRGVNFDFRELHKTRQDCVEVAKMMLNKSGRVCCIATVRKDETAPWWRREELCIDNYSFI